MKTDKQKAKIYHLVDLIAGPLLLLAAGFTALYQMRRGTEGSLTVAAVVLALCLLGAVAVKLLAWHSHQRTVRFYEGVLDTLPFMLHATDMDMNWTFMNKATMDFLKLERDEVMGLQCSNWNAVICNTDRCSAYCLRQGTPTTFFQQNGMDIRVDTNWLLDKNGERIGYVEAVQDISDTVGIQNRQKTFVDDVSDLCGAFVSASSEIASGAQMLATGAVEQSASVDALSDSINQVAEVVDRNVRQAVEAERLSQTIQMDAQTGSDHMRKMTQAVGEITEASQSISKVIKAIDDIAFQTNILALNAAVEAARAGQHGKGFAVVADEVRNLAGKSAGAARETGQLIQNSIEKARLGAQISQETAAALEKIIQGIQESSRLIHSITEASQEQDAAIRRINQGIEQVAAVVQQNSATAEQSASASEEMSNQTQVLQSMLDRFHDEHRRSAAVEVTKTGMRLEDAV